MKAELASVHSSEEQHFVTANIRSSTDYSTSSLYWLGGRLQRSLHGWRWADGSEMAFTAWLGEEPPGLAEEDLCLAMQWVSTGSAARPSGLYWQPRSCDALGGYVCKKSSQGVLLGFPLLLL
ncbi:echinoidin-like [Bacillus rossius redtenbacheri]|uniref:echinoidin-like n=1 Tax=Bacillus rossius redtenbacheri TaxID=93214 RepID=UPI002FDCBE78